MTAKHLPSGYLTWLPILPRAARGGACLTEQDVSMIADFVVVAILLVLSALKWGLIAYAVISWLIAFNVVNPYNQFVRSINTMLTQIFEPMLRPIRRIVPGLGGVDLSSLILIIIVIALQYAISMNYGR
jgi:YggT family protein